MRRIALVIGIALFVIIGTIIIFTVDWGGSKKPKEVLPNDFKITELATTDVKTSMFIRGAVNGNQDHKNLRITVGQSNVTGELINGYNDEVANSVELSNNANAYRTFLSALINYKFTKSQVPLKGVDKEGACPTSNLLEFSFTGNDSRISVKSAWATSCDARQGTFGGKTTLVKSLFINQIPRKTYEELTKDSPF